MHQNLFNAGFASVEYINAENKNVQAIQVIRALTKESRPMPGSFCCTYACLSSGPNVFFGLKTQGSYYAEG
jgi:hypothetical protein